MQRKARQFFPVFSGSKTLPLSTLLLAALCVLLSAPASQAASRDENCAAILTRVLTVSASSSQFSALQTRQVKVLLSRLEKSASQISFTEIERELASIAPWSTPAAELPSIVSSLKSKSQYFPSTHIAANLSGVRFNSYLE